MRTSSVRFERSMMSVTVCMPVLRSSIVSVFGSTGVAPRYSDSPAAELSFSFAAPGGRHVELEAQHGLRRGVVPDGELRQLRERQVAGDQRVRRRPRERVLRLGGGRHARAAEGFRFSLVGSITCQRRTSRALLGAYGPPTLPSSERNRDEVGELLLRERVGQSFGHDRLRLAALGDVLHGDRRFPCPRACEARAARSPRGP